MRLRNRLSFGMRMRVVAAVGMALLAAGVEAASFTGVGHLEDPPRASKALGVSADGRVVVGEAYVGEGGDFDEAFRWTAEGGMVSLGRPAGGDSSARGANADGSVIVGSNETAMGIEAFRWTAADGRMGIGHLPAPKVFDSAQAVSGDGSVVVGSGFAIVAQSAETFEAFRWTASGGMTGLGFLGGIFDDSSRAHGVSADGSTVVGSSSSSGGTSEAFRWTAAGGMMGLGQLGPEPSRSTTAAAISGDGLVIVGTGQRRSGTESFAEAFRWTAQDGLVRLGFAPGGNDSTALATNGDGSVVVGTSNEERRAVMWTQQSGMVDLRSFLTGLGTEGLEGWRLDAASGISADGLTIVGWGQDPAGRETGWVAVIPEPSGMMAVMGAGVVVMMRRRRGNWRHFSANFAGFVISPICTSASV